MNTRRRWHLSALAAAALIVAGCGGGNSTDSPLATRVVAFGDSLTDLGAYIPATSINGPGTGAPYFGGKFTTNSAHRLHRHQQHQQRQHLGRDRRGAPGPGDHAGNVWLRARHPADPCTLPGHAQHAGAGWQLHRLRPRRLARHRPGRHQQPQRQRHQRHFGCPDDVADGDPGRRSPRRLQQLQRRRHRLRLRRQQRRVHSVPDLPAVADHCWA